MHYKTFSHKHIPLTHWFSYELNKLYSLLLFVDTTINYFCLQLKKLQNGDTHDGCHIVVRSVHIICHMCFQSCM